MSVQYPRIVTQAALDKAAEIVDAAARRIETYGWTQGAHARDTDNLVVRAMSADAAYFSIYGAVLREIANAGLGGGDLPTQTTPEGVAIWTALTHQGVKDRTAYTGIHPVIEFNDAYGRTQAEVIGFLRDCANLLKTSKPTPEAQK